MSLRRAYKFRAYPNTGTRRRLWDTFRRAATPVWNDCVSEREAALKEYHRHLNVAIFLEEARLGRELSDKEQKALRNGASKKVKWPTAYDQYAQIRKSEHPEYGPYSSSMLECTVAKVDGSWKSFMALRKNGDKKAMPPRQLHCCHCLTFRKSGWNWPGGGQDASQQENRVEFMGIGSMKFKRHRQIEGKIKTVSITHEKTGEWYVSFSCEITDFSGACGPLPASKSCVRQDLQQNHTPPGGAGPQKTDDHNLRLCRSWPRPGGAGPQKTGDHNVGHRVSAQTKGGAGPQTAGEHNPPLYSLTGENGGAVPKKQPAVTLYFGNGFFLLDSDGREVAHPEFYQTEIAELRRLSRSLCRKQKAHPGLREDGSFRGRNRRKARRTLAKWHAHIKRRRDAFLWLEARFYAIRYQQIIVPEWPLKRKIEFALESKTAMKLCDGAYGRFLSMLRQKSEEFGSEVVERKEEWYAQEAALLDRVEHNEASRKMLREAKKAVKYDNRRRVGKIVQTYKQKLA